MAKQPVQKPKPDTMMSLIEVAYVSSSGLLRLRGVGFTPLGIVDLKYDYGTDVPTVMAQTKADAAGKFRFDQSQIPCGDRNGDPDVGVYVTATDRSTGQSIRQPFRTPC